MPLTGKRLLIVEDEYLVAMELAEAIELLGATVVGIAGTLSKAMEAANGPIDGALVDIQLGAEKSFPLVAMLTAAGVPLILLTGYDSRLLPEELRDVPRIAKPFSPRELEAMTRAVLLKA